MRPFTKVKAVFTLDCLWLERHRESSNGEERKFFRHGTYLATCYGFLRNLVTEKESERILRVEN